MSKKTFIGQGVRLREHMVYHIMPNNLRPRLPASLREIIQNVLMKQLAAYSEVLYINVDKEGGLDVGLKTTAPHPDLILKRVVNLLVDLGYVDLDAGLDSYVPGIRSLP